MQKLSLPKRQYSVQQRRETLTLARPPPPAPPRHRFAAAGQLGIPPHAIYSWPNAGAVSRCRRPMLHAASRKPTPQPSPPLEGV